MKLNEYLHRSGRTARGNAHGTSICILTVQQLNIIKKYEREFNIQFKEKKVFGGVLEDANYNSSTKQYEQKNKSYSSKFNK